MVEPDNIPKNVEFFTVDEVAELLKLHKQTVLARIASGELLACRFGPTILRIKKEDLEAYIRICRGA